MQGATNSGGLTAYKANRAYNITKYFGVDENGVYMEIDDETGHFIEVDDETEETETTPTT